MLYVALNAKFSFSQMEMDWYLGISADTDDIGGIDIDKVLA